MNNTYLNCSADTKHLIDSSVLEVMPLNSILINTARGDIIDTKALVEHLHRRPDMRVGLDVWIDEPTQSPSSFAENSVSNELIKLSRLEGERGIQLLGLTGL